jgi:5-oxoprolinase (ATP-hydrolysing) subunit A
MNGFDQHAPAAARAIDLNADLGEGFPNDDELLRVVSSASVSCAAHAGSPEEIRATLRSARVCGVVVGAHPGYADRDGFGRRDQEMNSDEVRTLLLDQVARLDRLARELRVPIRFLKPHGALYNQAQRQGEIARGVIVASLELGLPLLGQPATLLERLAREQGVPYVAEGFPERRYRTDGSLVPRSRQGAVLTELSEIEDQALRLAEQALTATLCIHGDDPHAVAKAKSVRRVLARNGIAIRSFLDSPSR